MLDVMHIGRIWQFHPMMNVWNGHKSFLWQKDIWHSLLLAKLEALHILYLSPALIMWHVHLPSPSQFLLKQKVPDLFSNLDIKKQSCWQPIFNNRPADSSWKSERHCCSERILLSNSTSFFLFCLLNITGSVLLLLSQSPGPHTHNLSGLQTPHLIALKTMGHTVTSHNLLKSDGKYTYK